MAFISSFAPSLPRPPVQTSSSTLRKRIFPIAKSSNPPTPPFQPFNGDVPLLPPYRPPTLELDFTYNSQRIVTREKRHVPPKQLVRIKNDLSVTLYAHVVQEAEKGGKVWLRPLLLDNGDGYVDLRGGSDLIWGRGGVENVGGENRVRVEVNLLATEGEIVGEGAGALEGFLKSFRRGE